jgi:hypothetical protein
MTDRIDELSPRALWFLQNFDEIELADICASQEASNQAREAAIARVRKVLAERRAEVAEREADGLLPFGTPGASWCDAVTVTCARIDDALRQPAGCDHDSQVMDHEGAQYWACMKCGTNLGRVEPAPDVGYAQAVDRVQSSGPQPAAHDAGPTVAEAAADDRAHWPERQWGGS